MWWGSLCRASTGLGGSCEVYERERCHGLQLWYTNNYSCPLNFSVHFDQFSRVLLTHTSTPKTRRLNLCSGAAGGM